MHSIVIADTSCLILFSKINLIELLHTLYPIVIITPEVADEYGKQIPEWISIQSAESNNTRLFEQYNLGKGEVSSLALALELKDTTIILDDDKAKKIARLFKLDITGSLGIIVKAKQKNLVPNVKDILNKIKATNFYLPSSLERIILEIAGEL